MIELATHRRIELAQPVILAHFRDRIGQRHNGLIIPGSQSIRGRFGTHDSRQSLELRGVHRAKNVEGRPTERQQVFVNNELGKTYVNGPETIRTSDLVLIRDAL
jgi:hypothetical protein